MSDICTAFVTDRLRHVSEIKLADPSSCSNCGRQSSLLHEEAWACKNRKCYQYGSRQKMAHKAALWEAMT